MGSAQVAQLIAPAQRARDNVVGRGRALLATEVTHATIALKDKLCPSLLVLRPASTHRNTSSSVGRSEGLTTMQFSPRSRFHCICSWDRTPLSVFSSIQIAG